MTFLSLATEKRDVTSSNNLGFEDKSFDRSLISIKKKSGSRINPCQPVH